MQKCDINCSRKCQNDIYIDMRCILHCKKNAYQKDRHSGLLSDFYDKFINYTIEQIFKHTELLNDKLTKGNITDYFKNNQFNNEEYNKILKKTIFIPSCIHFPTRDGRDTFDYLKILNLFGQIHFNNCEFYLYSLDLNNVDCFFQDCKFHYRWTLYNYNLLENEDNVIYQTCEFKKTVSNYTPENSTELAVYTYSQFDYTCTFKNSITLDRVKFENMLFNTNQYNYIPVNTIKQLKLEKCTFEKLFKLNNYTINEFICENSLFKGKFEFKENKLINFRLYNSNFDGISDLYGCQFIKFNIEKSIFNDFAGFEHCTFGTSNQLIEELAIFKYATFKDSLNVRDSKFLSGLDIKYINLYGESNFLDSEIESTNSPRDTFRKLKHEADKIGNIIDANKHYQKEMKERERKLKVNLPKDFFEWIIFKIHGFTSEHSQNALLPLFWIFILSYIYSYLFNFLDKKDYYQCILEYKFLNSIVYYIYSTDLIHLFMLSFLMLLPHITANSILKKNYYFLIVILSTLLYIYLTKDFTLSIVSNNINPFSIITEKGELNFQELLYRIMIAYLLYQLVILIRQNTRRK